MAEPSATSTISDGPEAVADRLAPLRGQLHTELAAVEDALRRLFAGATPTCARRAAAHLLAAGGKRLRPALCLLVARIGRGGGGGGALARAAELVHGATLLHDDVIDDADRRRGRDAARRIWGNAASVLGGDLLLVEALADIERSGPPELLSGMLGVLREMVEAESMQLDLRGRTDATAGDYFRISGGKTAALFRWLTEAGAFAGNLRHEWIAPLGRYGHELGLAFQLVDDLLDLSDEDSAGKAALQDVRQGTVTYPTIAALRAEPALAKRIRSVATGSAKDPSLGRDLLRATRRHGGFDDARRQIAQHTQRAQRELRPMLHRPAARALHDLAGHLAERRS